MSATNVKLTGSRRIRLRSQGSTRTTTPLSISDCTTANFSHTSAVWIFEDAQSHKDIDLISHYEETLLRALEAYPHFAGQLEAVVTTDSSTTPETASFPNHARRYGRLYVKFGDIDDPGVEFTSAESSVTLDELCPTNRTANQPIWDSNKLLLKQFMPSTPISRPLSQSLETNGGDRCPLLTIQVTILSTGGTVIGINISHPLADITTLVAFMKTWSNISVSKLSNQRQELLLNPVFDPCLLDKRAAGDINQESVDTALLQKAKELPLHRYDWWASSSDCPWGPTIPEPFRHNAVTPTGKAMPWNEWDVGAAVSNRILHLNKEQVDLLWNDVVNGTGTTRLSKHDAVLAHVWSRIIRARRLDDSAPVHCDLAYGLRPILQLGSNFIGSPVMMINIEMEAKAVAEAKGPSLQRVAAQVRETLERMADPDKIGLHLHALAYEKSPQRIWQAFLGKRHILVTTWARAGVYAVNFGLGSVRYAEGIVPDMDGNVIIKEAPPVGNENGSWTDNGVDVLIHLREEDMQRLIEDEELHPAVGAA